MLTHLLLGDYRMEGDRQKLTFILWVVTVLWICFCLFLSWQRGEDTSLLSGRIAYAAKRVIYLFDIEIDLDTLHMWLHKCAHVAMFFVLAILLISSVRRSLPRSPYLPFWACAVTVAACSARAVFAEVGRYGSRDGICHGVKRYLT